MVGIAVESGSPHIQNELISGSELITGGSGDIVVGHEIQIRILEHPVTVDGVQLGDEVLDPQCGIQLDCRIGKHRLHICAGHGACGRSSGKHLLGIHIGGASIIHCTEYACRRSKVSELAQLAELGELVGLLTKPVPQIALVIAALDGGITVDNAV